MSEHKQRPKVARSALIAAGLLLAAAALLYLITDGIGPRFWWFAALATFLPLSGSLFFLLMYPLTGGRWLGPLLPSLRRQALWLPVSVVLFVPLLLLRGDFLFWLEPEGGHIEELAEQRRAFFNWPFFMTRNLAYALVFGSLGFWASRQRYGEAFRKRGVEGPLLVLLGLAYFFFSVDWIMVLEPEWFSSGFPFVVMISAALSALSLAAVTSWRHKGDSFPRHRVGNLLMACLLFWTYLLLMDFIIVWMGDMPHDRALYSNREDTLHNAIVAGGAVLCVALPFLALLQPRNKIRRKTLSRIAGLTLLAPWLLLFWFGWSEDFATTLVLELFLASLCLGGLLFLWLAFNLPTIHREHAELNNG